MPVVADVDADPPDRGVEDRKSQIPRSEVERLPEPGHMRNVGLAVLAEIAAVGVEDGRGVVQHPGLLLLVHRQHHDHAELGGQRLETLGPSARRPVGPSSAAAAAAAAADRAYSSCALIIVSLSPVRAPGRGPDRSRGPRSRTAPDVGRAERREHQQHGEQDLDEEDAAEAVAARRVHAVAIGAEPLYSGRRLDRSRVGEQPDRARGDDRAHALRRHVTQRVPWLDLPAQQQPEGHRRIHVATGDRPDHVYQHEQRQAECQRDPEHAHVVARQHGRPHPAENQHERSETFDQVPTHTAPPPSPRPPRPQPADMSIY